MPVSKDDIVERNFHINSYNAIDMHVGKRVRLRRTFFNISQEQLGSKLNFISQQVQKYVRGANRISASRPWDISQTLGVPISYFFDDMSKGTICSSPSWISHGDSEGALNAKKKKKPMTRHETLELVQTYYTIEKPVVCK